MSSLGTSGVEALKGVVEEVIEFNFESSLFWRVSLRDLND